MTISIRLDESDTLLFKKYAKLNGITVSELIRTSVIEHIEDEYDLTTYRESLAEFQADPITYSLDAVERELGLR